METIFYRNGYPKALVKNKMKKFLEKTKKPEEIKIDTSLCLQYSCYNTEMYAKQLVQKMKDVLPNFQINIAFRTVKIAQLFSRSGKPDRLPTFETPDTNYHFICDSGADRLLQTMSVCVNAL